MDVSEIKEKNTATVVSSEDKNIFSMFSKYRGQLFGIALILISIAHFKPHVTMTCNLGLPQISQSIMNLFNFSGACGVKIFFFLAGFGSYFSLVKNSDDLQFYLRRAKRMFPYYYPMVFLCIFMLKPSALIIAGNLSLFGWWLSNPINSWHQFFWFHQAIYIIYVMTPIFFRILNTQKNTFVTTACLWAIFLGIGLAFSPEVKVQGVQIIPLYITGMLLAKLNIEGAKISKYLEPIIYASGIISYILLLVFFKTYGGVFDDYIPKTSEHLLISLCSIALLLLSLRLLISIDKGIRGIPSLLKVLSIIGKRSLEIYLVQAVFICQFFIANDAGYFKRVYLFFSPDIISNSHAAILLGCIVIICTVMGIGYGVLVDKLTIPIVKIYNNIKFKMQTQIKNL